MEKWDIFDENMNKTGKIIKYNELLQEGEYHLSIHVWIENIDKKYILQKRAKTMKRFPDMWSVVTGGVIAGEKAIEAAIRETKEELGIEISKKNMKKLGIVKRKYDFVEIWKATQEIDLNKIRMQKSEVSEVKLSSKIEIKEMIKQGIVAESVIDEFNQYILSYNQ